MLLKTFNLRTNSLIILALLSSSICYAQVTLSADGPGNTYSLITSVLAPGFNPIETPDCGHTSFGEHIDEVFDTDLNEDVFRFILHTSPDDDRCINTDRQRCEIKTYDKSPANLLAVQDESVVYSWKFKLPLGFQSSSNFTHIHQLKSVDDPFDSMPMYTLTARKGSPDKLEIRYAEFGSSNKLTEVDITPFLGQWVKVTESISYSNPGIFSIEIRKVSDNDLLMSYSDSSVNNWRVGAAFIRPKWGIYRSLLNVQDLRDEEVFFNDFGVEELATPLAIDELQSDEKLKIFPNPASNIIKVVNVPIRSEFIEIYSIYGQRMLWKSIENGQTAMLDISYLSNGNYVINVANAQSTLAQRLITINH